MSTYSEGVSSGTICTGTGTGIGKKVGLRDFQPNLTSSIPSSNSSSSQPSASSDSQCAADTDPGSRRQSKAYLVLFKQGDDIRQDEIAIQLIRFMDFALKGQGLDLRLITYDVLSLGSSEVTVK